MENGRMFYVWSVDRNQLLAGILTEKEIKILIGPGLSGSEITSVGSN